MVDDLMNTEKGGLPRMIEAPKMAPAMGTTGLGDSLLTNMDATCATKVHGVT
jgi:hypothetical protein